VVDGAVMAQYPVLEFAAAFDDELGQQLGSG
jgi:hypothetical protein